MADDKGKPERPKSAADALDVGNAFDTKKVRVDYDKHQEEKQTAGETPMDWPTFADSKGYGLDKSGLVYKKK